MAEKKSINLVISNNQYSEKLIPTGQTYKRVLILEDNIEVTTEGFLYNKGKSMYITYDEVADGGLENTKTIVKSENSLDEDGFGKISADYKIKMEPYVNLRNKLEIEVKPC